MSRNYFITSASLLIFGWTLNGVYLPQKAALAVPQKSCAEKSRKVLMMMKAAKLGWAGAGTGQEQGWSKAIAGLRRVKQSRAEAEQKLGRS